MTRNAKLCDVRFDAQYRGLLFVSHTLLLLYFYCRDNDEGDVSGGDGIGIVPLAFNFKFNLKFSTAK